VTTEPWGARWAGRWVAVYTAAAPAWQAADRRAEVAADVADELRATGPEGSGRVVSRLLRGMPADLAWRLSVEFSSGRAAWHLAHPVALIGALTVLSVPFIAVGDLVRRTATSTSRLAAIVHGAVALLAAAVVTMAFTGLVRRLADRRPLLGSGRPILARVRRLAGVAACVAWALAALWRFVPGWGSRVSAAAWGAFGVCVVVWAVLACAARLARGWRQRSMP
jgi:hypothetical protein